MNELDRAFEKAVDEMLREIDKLREITNNYDPIYFKKMRNESGAVAATKELVVKPNQTSGFKRLCDAGLSRLTLEALVLRPEFQELFSENEIECAKNNLRNQGCLL